MPLVLLLRYPTQSSPAYRLKKLQEMATRLGVFMVVATALSTSLGYVFNKRA